jgi:hypothetical protein
VSRVSMPPRRSCFAWMAGWLEGGYNGFNATTAFLLQGSRGEPRGR